MNRKLFAALIGIAALATGIVYQDLLASAFAKNPFPQSLQSVARGKVLYEQHCVVCHGPSGRGDGPAASTLNSSMDDLSDLPPPPIFPDGVIVYRIAKGKNLMPAWGQALSQNDLWDLLNYLRSLRPSANS